MERKVNLNIRDKETIFKLKEITANGVNLTEYLNFCIKHYNSIILLFSRK